MAEKKAVGHAYNVDFLNVVFAASSIFLFIAAIWMVWDDFDREWKNTQRQFNQLEIEVTRANLAQAERRIDKAKLTQLQQQLAAQQKSIEANRQQIDEIQSKLKDVDARLFRVNQAAQFAKARYDVDRYAFEVDRAKNPNGAAERLKAIEDQAKRLQELNLEVEKVTAERTALQNELGKYTGQAAALQKQLDQLTFDQNRLSKQ